MKFIQAGKHRTLEALIYPILLLLIIWIVFLLDKYLHLNLYQWGVKPRTTEGLKGILFMPLIHDAHHFKHILSNSLPLLVLLSTLIYFYREIALKIFCFLWIGTGILLWIIAQNTGSYHIGFSGMIYGMFGFLLISGFLKKYLPLQAISLFVAFAYGSIVWGILPLKIGVSWEGHLSGLVIGIMLAIVYRRAGPQRPKYAYELEEEVSDAIIIETTEEINKTKEMSHSEITTKEPKTDVSLPKIIIHYHYTSSEKHQKK